MKTFSRKLQLSTAIALSSTLLLTACPSDNGNIKSSGDKISKKNKALLVIDVQKCFTKGGSLAVPKGDEVVPYINKLIDSKKYGKVVLSQDWHPQNNVSFASNHKGKKVYEVIKVDGFDQVLWPDHCVQNTDGAKFHADLKADKADYVVQKGTLKDYDSYSAFEDNNGKHSTPLNAYLKKQNIKEVDIVGLALDYCVKYTALDAIKNGYKVNVYVDGTRAVNVNATDGQKAIDEMKKAGVNVIE